MFASKHRKYKLFPLVNRRVVPGLSRLSKSLCVQSLCAFILPYASFLRVGGNPKITRIRFFAASEAQNPAISATDWLRARSRPPWSWRFCDASFAPLAKIGNRLRHAKGEFPACVLKCERDPQFLEEGNRKCPEKAKAHHSTHLEEVLNFFEIVSELLCFTGFG